MAQKSWHRVNSKGQTPFDLRLENCPHQWRSALVDVTDTLEAIVMKLEEFGWDEDGAVAVELTRMVLERHKELEDQS
jgi:hypothetical protein